MIHARDARGPHTGRPLGQLAWTINNPDAATILLATFPDRDSAEVFALALPRGTEHGACIRITAGGAVVWGMPATAAVLDQPDR